MRREPEGFEAWVFQVAPYPMESFGHYLGRFRRANVLSSSQLSAYLGVGQKDVSYWETPSRRRRPTLSERRQLCSVLGIGLDRLNQMWLPKGEPFYLPTRLCALCYAEQPCHQVIWQQAHQSSCALHGNPFLTACPQCDHVFLLPSHWVNGQCEWCGLPFIDMAWFHSQ